MSLLLNALKDAEGRKRAQQAAAVPAAPVPAEPAVPAPAPAPADLGEVAALLSSTEEDTLLSLEEDVVELPRETAAARAPEFPSFTPAPTPAVAVQETPAPAAAAAPSPTAFPGLPTPQAILRARAERAAPAQPAQGSAVAAARAARGTPKSRQASAAGGAPAEAGLDALAQRLAAHLPAQLRAHPLPVAGGVVAVLLIVGWLILGTASPGAGDAPAALGPTLPSTAVAAVPTPAGAESQGPDDVAPPPVTALGTDVATPTLGAPLRLTAEAGAVTPAPLAAPTPELPAATPPPRVPYTGARITPRLEIAGRPSPLPAAYAALRAGDLALAERLYTETLAGEPDQPDAHLGLAALAQGRGDDAAAVRHYRAVLEAVPDHPRAWAGLAALAGSGELEPMESKLRGLIATRPAPALHFALGNVLARQGRWAEAQQGFFAASAADPQNADYAFNLAVSLERIGKASAASPHYARAASLAEAGAPAQFLPAVARQRLAELQPGTP